MKTIQSTIALSVLFSLVVGLASPTQVKAQTWVQSAIAAAQAQAAEEPITNKTIPVVANPSDSPPGTYWSLQLTDQPPLPDCPFPDLQVIEITNGIYLMDDRSVDYPALWAELDDQVQSSAIKNKGKSGGSMMDMAGGDSFDAFSYSSDQLYLEITNIADGLVYLNLDNATNEVYAVWSTTNLSTGWSVETDLWPTNPVTMPFTVQTLNRQNLFLRAEDWTGVTDNGNTTPNWWFWENFGAIWSTLYDTNVDSRGNTYAFDYQNGIDPNPIQFSIAPTNPYVNSSSVTVPLNIITGIPFGMAILIDSTNFVTAAWQPYNSNVAVTLGATNGAYDVWIGLRGRLTNTLQVWQGTTITFDTVPPTITITNPTTAVVSQPLIQLQGYASEPLSSFTYDLTNALGQVTNQTVFMISESPDTNAGNYTTSYFQGYDIPLTNGLNTITLHASDLAGNTTTTNLNFTLDYSDKTNAPTITISWPPSNSVFAGTNFTLSGSLSDDTASVTVTGFGGTNTAAVQRGGKFTVANLPLSNPTNTFTVTVTDVVGNSSSLQWTVFQSAASVTIDSLSAAALSQPLVTVTGTINVNNLDVWVNGVQATVTGGTWQANNVPVSIAAGTGEFDVSLYATGTTSPLVGAQSSVVELPPVIQAASYLRVYSFFNSGACGVLPDGTSLIENWQLGVGGRDVEVDYDEARSTTNITEYDFAPDSPIPVSPWQNVLTKDGDRGQGSASECGGTFTFSYATSDFQSTRLQLVAGGSADRSAQQLVRLTASFQSNGNTVPPSQVTSFGQVWTPTSTNSDVGELYVTLPAGATQDFTFSSSSFDNLSMVGAQAEAVTLQSLTVVSNSAVQIDVTDCATVKTASTNNFVILQATISNTNAASQIKWTGGQAVPGNPLQRQVSTATASETGVTASLGSTNMTISVWVLWSQITIKTTGTVSTGDDAAILDANHFWPLILGGGNSLGPIDHFTNTNLTYSTCVGRMEAEADLQPSGIANVITSGWHLHRTAQFIAWNNGALTASDTNNFTYDDTSSPEALDEDPRSGTSTGQIYDLDGPGCPIIQGTTVNHTSEVYDNFKECATLTLGGVEQPCSDTNTWSYSVQIDIDKSTNKVELNSLTTSLITIPTTSHYTPR